MKDLTFKIGVLMLITSVSVFAQKKTVYSQRFSTDENTTAIFNLENTTVSIETSTDGKVHFDYTLEFDGYSAEEIRDQLKDIKVEATKFENQITLVSNSVTKISSVSYAYNAPNGLVLDYDSAQKLKDSIVRKSRDSIIEEIRYNAFGKINAPFKYFGDRFKTMKANGKLKNIKKSDIKIFRSQFVIKIPPDLKLKINGKDAQITMRDDSVNELSVVLKRGYFYAKQLKNKYNVFKIKNAHLRAEAIAGGSYTFNNISKGLIGSLQNVKITSEFSKIQIGELKEKVSITDFNSEYFFYNWGRDFKRFDLFSEYSKIHLFYPKNTDFTMKVMGNNTKSMYGKDLVIEMQPARKGVKHYMMERKAKGEGHFAGAINFDIIHGIIYNYNDTFKTSKN
ncbi:hypothetical protein ES692_16225 [Psychroserpens burtonensis]|uniref:DUF4097 domain-containing protein n=1 Tax=Psychroserpens burtonensis TaxID=49278 RepID=A0A5C7B2T8_9FLAO|nr:hypothetical protein [Psychroserpens burtonensis]TXE15528.1 hypothetical protein ES692_16225 [Psychroserpens burtonensis]